MWMLLSFRFVSTVIGNKNVLLVVWTIFRYCQEKIMGILLVLYNSDDNEINNNFNNNAGLKMVNQSGDWQQHPQLSQNNSPGKQWRY